MGALNNLPHNQVITLFLDCGVCSLIQPFFSCFKVYLESNIGSLVLNSRYMDGEHLKPEDMKAVVEKLLVYHPHADDKVGCGLDSIMVKFYS